MLRTMPILIAHRTCRGLGRQSETNRVMRSPARSRGDFGSFSIQPPSLGEEVWIILGPRASTHRRSSCVRIGRRGDVYTRPERWSLIGVGSGWGAFISSHIHPIPLHVDPGSRSESPLSASSKLDRTGLCRSVHPNFGESPFYEVG